MYLVFMTTNFADGWSFSKLKLLKNYLKSSIEHQDCVNALAIFSISYIDILWKIKLDDIMNDFTDTFVK